MAKKHDRHNNTKRDASDIATDSEVLRTFIKKSSVVPRPLLTLIPPKDLRPIQDRRTWSPTRHTSAASIDRPHHKLRLPVRAGKAQLSRPHGHLASQIGFDQPRKVLICIRRKTRKQVLFAKRRTRKGSRSRKHRNYFSEIQC